MPTKQPCFADGRPWTCQEWYRQRPDGGWHIPEDVLRKHRLPVRVKACDAMPAALRRGKDSDEELLALIRKYLRSSKSPSQRTSIIEPDNSIPARAHRDVWDRNPDARRLRGVDAADPNEALNRYYAQRHAQAQPTLDSTATGAPLSLGDLLIRARTGRARAADSAEPLDFFEQIRSQCMLSSPVRFGDER